MCPVASKVNTLGLMLPYTPLHSLIPDAATKRGGKKPQIVPIASIADFAAAPDPTRPHVQVMTRGNLSNEPTVTASMWFYSWEMGQSGLSDPLVFG